MIQSRDVTQNQSTIRHKISRKMILQACLIALVAMLAIGFSSVILEQFLVREALNREATHFWNNYESNALFPAPNTDNLKGYLTTSQSNGKLPEELTGYDLGYHKIHGQIEHSLLFVTERKGVRLHLLFDGKSVTRLAVFFGVVPLTIILILIYITAWWVYKESTILLSPIIWLANKFDQVDPASTEATAIDLNDIPGDVDWEADTLIKSYVSYSNRIRSFIERERAFTRDASHEFRTPLTVINMAADMLMSEQDLNKYSRKYVTKIKNSAQDMQALIDAFLILARETYKEFEHEEVNVIDVVRNEVSAASIYLEGKPVSIRVNEEYSLQLTTAKQVLAIVLGNLIRNAILYTNAGEVVVSIERNSVTVTDTGIGMNQTQIGRIFQPYYRAEAGSESSEKSPSRKGYGVGLTIVKRLSNRFNWQLDVSSEVNVGTTITLNFT